MVELKRQLLFFVYKIVHNFKFGFNLVRHFFNLNYILAVFKDNMTIKWLCKEKYRLLHSTTQGSIFSLSLYPTLILTCTPFKLYGRTFRCMRVKLSLSLSSPTVIYHKVRRLESINGSYLLLKENIDNSLHVPIGNFNL